MMDMRNALSIQKQHLVYFLHALNAAVACQTNGAPKRIPFFRQRANFGERRGQLGVMARLIEKADDFPSGHNKTQNFFVVNTNVGSSPHTLEL